MTRRRLAAAAATLLTFATAVAASPVQAAPGVFRAVDRSIVCAHGLHPQRGADHVSCYSDQLLDKQPETDDCGSGASTASLFTTGRVRLRGVCNPYGLGQRVYVLRPGKALTYGAIRCVAEQRSQIRCQSRRSGHGFRVAPKRWSRW